MSATPPISRWTSIRESATTVREVIIAISLIALLFTPTKVRGLLEDAGIRSVAGIEFDATSLAESEAELLATQEMIDSLESQLGEAQTQLASISQQDSPGLTAIKVGKVSRLLTTTQDMTHDAKESVKHSKRLHDQFISGAIDAGYAVPASPNHRRSALIDPEVLFGGSEAQQTLNR